MRAYRRASSRPLPGLLCFLPESIAGFDRGSTGRGNNIPYATTTTSQGVLLDNWEVNRTIGVELQFIP